LTVKFGRSDRGAAPQARRPGVGAPVLVAISACLALAGCAVVAGSPGSNAAGHPTGSSKYGSLPSFLPHETFDTDRVLVGSVAKPALTTEGDTVSVGGGAGAAQITVTGPEVPGEGLPYQSEATTCTWTVTVRTGSLGLNVSATDFSTIDHLGTIYQPSLVPGQPSPPAVVAPHTSVTFELRAVMVVGEGLMVWSPDGKHPVAKWDFEVEND
jgi:hypothetical protein